MVFGLPGYPFRIASYGFSKDEFFGCLERWYLEGNQGNFCREFFVQKISPKVSWVMPSTKWTWLVDSFGNDQLWLSPKDLGPSNGFGWMNLYDAAGCFGPQNSHFWGSNDPLGLCFFFLGVCFLCFHPKRGARIEFVSFFMKTFGVFASNRFHRGKIWNCRVLGDEQSWAVMSNGSFFLYEIDEKMSWLLGGWEHQSGNHHLPVSWYIWKQESSLATWYIMQLGSLVPNIRNWKIPGEVCRSFWYSSFSQRVKANPGGPSLNSRFRTICNVQGRWMGIFVILGCFQRFTIWGFPKMVGFPNNHWFYYLKWSFWGVLGVPPFKETPIW